MFSDKTVGKVFAAFALAVFAVVFIRLIDLQIFEGKRYKSFVTSQISARLMVSKNRGLIYDRDGNIMARNKSTASLYAFGKNITDLKEFSSRLTKNGISLTKKTRTALASREGFTWIDRQIDLDKAEKLKKTIPGLEYFKEEARFYPQGTVMASIVGFTGTDNEGRAGVEYMLDKELAGEKATVASLRDSRGRVIMFDDKSNIVKPDSEVYLTIPARIQAAAEYILRSGAQKFGAKDGSVVAIDIHTGDIILAANVRKFDPHEYTKYPNESWKNHAFTYVYEPGSIFKTVAFSYLFENGKLDRTKLVDTGKKITVGGYTYSDVKDYGVLSVDEVFTYSSNIGMATLIKNEKNADFHAFLKLSGFGTKAGVIGASEESGVLKEPSQWSKTSRTSMAIGYEVLVTSLQVARFYAAIANGGIMVTPVIIDRVVKNGTVKKTERKETRIMAETTAEYMMSLMRKTVETGTGKNASTTLTKIAGKTGTASIYDNNAKQYSKQNYSASFAGIFPADNPQIAMVVVYESPSSSIYGGSTAANIFRQIAEYISSESKFVEHELTVAYEKK